MAYDFNTFKDILRNDQILVNEPMKEHTTFKIGGHADLFLLPKSVDEISRILKECKKNNISYFVIGNGSNLLVRDGGFRGVIICVGNLLSNVSINGLEVTAEAGVTLSNLAGILARNSLKGFEFASGIPGTLGGAIFMNAGAYEHEIKDVVKSVTVLDKNFNTECLSCDEMKFSYRKSSASENNLIVLSANLVFAKGITEEISQKIKKLSALRKEKQPIHLPSAGSAFKRPTGFYAGKLIADSGLKGAKVGGASISEMHCGFIVNNGNATANDVLNLVKLVQTEVNSKFGVKLETEFVIIGED